MIVVCILAMTLLGAAASLFLKMASNSGSAVSIIKSFHFYVGGLLYFLSALLNIYLLKHIDYSILLPLTSITYIWTLVLSFLFLKEKISVRLIAGIALVICGVTLLYAF